MPESPNTGAPHIEPNQNDKHVTANTAVDRLSRFVSETGSFAITGDRTLSAVEFQTAARFKLTGTPGAAFTLNVPATVKRSFLIYNDTDANATVQVDGGAGAAVVVNAGSFALLDSDGADVSEVVAGGGTPYDVGLYAAGQPGAGETLLRFILPRPITLPGGLPGSQGYVGTAPADGAAVFSIKKNGAGVGTLEFASGATTATFTLSSDTSFAAGDRLEVSAPNTQDSALENLSITLAGTR